MKKIIYLLCLLVFTSTAFAQTKSLSHEQKKGNISVGANLGRTYFDDGNAFSALLSADYSVFINSNLLVGAGFGINYVDLSSGAFAVPVYANLRYVVNDFRMKPFVNIKGGYSISFEKEKEFIEHYDENTLVVTKMMSRKLNGLFVDAMICFSQDRMHFGIGYRMQECDYKYTYVLDLMPAEQYSIKMNTVYLQVGLDF